MHDREHEALYRAAAEKASIRRTQSLSKCVFKEASLTCSLCEIKPANLAGKEHHKNIEDRLATQLKTIHEQWLRAQNTEEFLSLLDLQRFWCLYFECLALIEHIQVQSSKQEAEVLVRERSVLDAALSDLSAIHRPLGKHISSLRGVKSRLMSIYLDQCVLCTPGRYSIKDRHETEDSHRVHNALPFSSHLLELKSSSPYFSLTGNKKRTSEELCALLEHPNELSELEQKQALQELLSYIEGGAEESNVTLLRLWSLLCQFVRRAYITEVDTLSVLFEMKLKLLSALRHGNSEESLCAISFKHVWRFLLICRCDLGVLTMLLKVILELAAITPRFIDSFSALDEVVFVIFNQVENDSHVRILLLRTLLVFVLGPLSAQCLTRAPMTDEAGFERLSHALHELFKEFEGEGTATESDLDTFMYEVIDLLTTPHVFSALPERWKHSVIPLSCLSRMLRHLKSLAANKNSSAADLHKVCVFMMRISKTYGRYAGSLRLSVELVEMLRSVDTTNTSHLLAACSAIGKLIISFCMREPSLKEALKDSELVNALKEKKHQVVQLVAAGPRDSADLINRCNMSAFTLTTAVQSIVLGQPQDAQNLDILTSLGY
ncbi:hypothetical protein EON65_13485 [archaeon]|nr:MAG: hypothetical protein EON65_13485 [archaeon]